MDFKTLCQRVRQESGISGTGPITVVGQLGEMKRIVDWTTQAYTELCSKHANWDFLRSSFSVNTVIGQEAYLPTACTDTNLSALIGSSTVGNFGQWVPDSFRIYLQSAGAQTQQYFWPLDYPWFRDRWQLQVPANAKPTDFTFRPKDKAILCGAKPDNVYVLSGDYFRVAPDLAADGDVPLFPERFHMIVAWLAVRYYAAYEEDGGIFSVANQYYQNLYGNLMRDQLPQVGTAEPLA